MPFQISELVIRVTAGPGADPGTECRKGGTTCMPPTPEPGTECRKGGTTCMISPDATACRKGGTSCPTPGPGTACRHQGTTCKTATATPLTARDAELELVLRQIRERVSTSDETADDEALVTA